ncbi:tellurite resistance TerB family protein [Planctomycetes bacterium Poly30]
MPTLPPWDDTCVTASNATITLGAYSAQPNRSLGPQDLTDHYRAILLPGARAEIGAVFAHADGNIDLRLWNEDCSAMLVESLSASDDELVSWTNSSNAPVEIVAEVFLASVPAAEVTYRFTTQGFFVTCDFEDIFEDNETCATAFPLAFAEEPTSDYLTIRPGDDDFFAITVPPMREQLIQVLNNGSVTNVDAELLDASCTTVLASSATTGWETLRASNSQPVPQTFHVRVYRADTLNQCSVYFLRRTTEPGVSYCTSAPSSAGAAANAYAGGSTSFAANDLALYTFPTPLNAFGMFLYSQGRQAVPLGNSLLCVGTTIQRGPVLSAFGDIFQWNVDYTRFAGSPIPFQSGGTYHFQAWFRDVNTGGFTFGLSDGYSVLLTP